MTWPWRRRREPAPVKSPEVETLLPALDESLVAADVALAALDAGKPADCAEVRAMQAAVRKANDAAVPVADELRRRP